MLEFDEIRNLLEIAKSRGYSEVEASLNGVHFKGHLESTGAPQSKNKAANTVETTVEPESPSLGTITSPCVGYFHNLGAPLSKGDTVKQGDVIAKIVALGLPNDVESKVNGTVVNILVNHESPVEFGQTLFEIEVQK